MHLVEQPVIQLVRGWLATLSAMIFRRKWISFSLGSSSVGFALRYLTGDGAVGYFALLHALFELLALQATATFLDWYAG